MGVEIHPHAVVEPGAELDDDVVVGPFCLVGKCSKVASGSRLFSHVTIMGKTTLGRRTLVFPGAVLGAPPQDRSFGGEASELVLGDDNTVRESATLHGGTAKGDGVTRVGSGCLLMVGSHVAHDCRVGDGVILTNQVSLGGHVEIGTGAVIGGHSAVAPFCHVGALAFVAGGTMVERDVPPFVVVDGHRARVRALNTVGLRRNGVPEESIHRLRRAVRIIWHRGPTVARGAAQALAEFGDDEHVARLARTLLEASGPRLRRTRSSIAP